MIITITDEQIRVKAYYEMKRIIEDAKREPKFYSLSFDQENELGRIVEETETMIERLTEMQKPTQR